jgi:hypothetical protein
MQATRRYCRRYCYSSCRYPSPRSRGCHQGSPRRPRLNCHSTGPHYPRWSAWNPLRWTRETHVVDTLGYFSSRYSWYHDHWSEFSDIKFRVCCFFRTLEIFVFFFLSFNIENSRYCLFVPYLCLYISILTMFNLKYRLSELGSIYLGGAPNAALHGSAMAVSVTLS